MWSARFLLHLVVLLAWSRIVRSQDGFSEEPELPVLFCAGLCCGDPVPIPVEQNFQMFIIPFETEDQTTFSNAITKDQALTNLSQDFLQPETIEELAGFASNFYEMDFSSLSLYSVSRCDIPLSRACMVQKCGCNSRRRNLLQCYPVFACTVTGAGAIEDADLAGTVELPPPVIFGICLMETCTLFQIRPNRGEFFEFALDNTCPDILPVPAPVTVTAPLTSVEDSTLGESASPPPLDSAITTTSTAPPPPPPPPPGKRRRMQNSRRPPPGVIRG